jgi:NAD(P)-dependent dehydrogenase (short-subunit alcohol dehydrogenase family)
MGVTGRFEGKRCLVAGRGETADAVATRLGAEGGAVARLDAEPLPLATEAVATAAVEQAVSTLGGLDVLVTAFCEREAAPFLSIDDEAWQRALDANLKAAFLVGRECARAMVASGAGVIVHVGSDVGARPGPGTAAYAAAKAGVHLLTTCMALDLVPDGVRVCGVAACEDGSEPPGASGLGPEDVAAAVAFSASDAGSYVLGSTFFLNGPLPVRG